MCMWRLTIDYYTTIKLKLSPSFHDISLLIAPLRNFQAFFFAYFISNQNFDYENKSLQYSFWFYCNCVWVCVTFFIFFFLITYFVTIFGFTYFQVIMWHARCVACTFASYRLLVFSFHFLWYCDCVIEIDWVYFLWSCQLEFNSVCVCSIGDFGAILCWVLFLLFKSWAAAQEVAINLLLLLHLHLVVCWQLKEQIKFFYCVFVADRKSVV